MSPSERVAPGPIEPPDRLGKTLKPRMSCLRRSWHDACNRLSECSRSVGPAENG